LAHCALRFTFGIKRRNVLQCNFLLKYAAKRTPFIHCSLFTVHRRSFVGSFVRSGIQFFIHHSPPLVHFLISSFIFLKRRNAFQCNLLPKSTTSTSLKPFNSISSSPPAFGSLPHFTIYPTQKTKAISLQLSAKVHDGFVESLRVDVLYRWVI